MKDTTHFSFKGGIDHLVLFDARHARKLLGNNFRLPVIIVTSQIGQGDFGIGKRILEMCFECLAVHGHGLVSFSWHMARNGSRVKSARIRKTVMLRHLLFSMLLLAACSAGPEPISETSEATGNPAYDARHHEADRALATLRTLSSDRFAGRRTGTPGNARAIAWLEDRLSAMEVAPYGKTGYRRVFTSRKFGTPDEPLQGTNLLAMIEGNDGADSPIIVLSAHFDHLGQINGDIYNGADDNASGVAALLETISWFQTNPPEATIIFAFFDAEEAGFGGSSHFVRTLSTTDRSRLAFNLNLDMVARADDGVLYAVGAYHHPQLVPVIDRVARSAPITLKRGHDSPEWGDEDWSLMSDHAPFLRAGIPIIYLGVENHADYHQPTDTFDRVDPATFARSVDTVILMAEAVDKWVAEEK